MDIYHNLPKDLQTIVLNHLEDANRFAECYSITFNEHSSPTFHVYAWNLWRHWVSDSSTELDEIFTLMKHFSIKTIILHCENDNFPMVDYIVEEIIDNILRMKLEQVTLAYSTALL